ncbi:hypothetical protein L6R49_23255 [Myxococcota bacterium]|nr:hypothetical protein [Myxococcota bacterium]
MKLDPADLDALASFFARRFPGAQERALLCMHVGLRAGREQGDDLAIWLEIVKEAYRRRRLLRLARAAQQARRDDENLQVLIRTLSASGPPPWAARAVGLALLIVLIVAGLKVVLRPKGEPAAPETPAVTAPVVAPEVEAPPVDAPPVEAPAVEAPPVEAPPVEPPPAEAPVEAPALPPVEELAELTPPKPKASPAPSAGFAGAQPAERIEGRCGGVKGQPLGFWYAGSTMPGKKGEVYTVKAGANVRGDYPRKANNYNARAPLACALISGDRVRISGEPVLVGEDWWVPMAVGDLLNP